MSNSGSITDGRNTYVFSGPSFDLLKALNVNIQPGATTTFSTGEYTQLVNLFQNNGVFTSTGNAGIPQVAVTLAGLTSKIAALTRQLANKVDKIIDDKANGKITFSKAPKTKADNSEIESCDSNLITKHYADANYSGVPAKFKGEFDPTFTYDKDDVVTYLGSSYISIETNNDSLPTECKWRLIASKGKGMNVVGKYNSCEEYDVNDIVYRF